MKKLLFSTILMLAVRLAACGDAKTVTDDKLTSDIEQEEPVEVSAEAEEEPAEEPVEIVEEVEESIEEPLSTEDSIKKFINSELGEKTNTGKSIISNVSLVDGSLSVEINGNDNLSAGFIRDGMLDDPKKFCSI